MTTAPTWPVNAADLAILRKLARRYAEIANQPSQAARRELWRDHNDCKPTRPMVLVEATTSGLQQEIFADQPLCCQAPWACTIERDLRARIYAHTVVEDDDVPAPWYAINWRLDTGSYGVEVRRHRGTDATSLWIASRPWHGRHTWSRSSTEFCRL